MDLGVLWVEYDRLAPAGLLGYNDAVIQRAWRLKPELGEAERARFAAAGLHPLLAQLLVNRGIIEPVDAQTFLRTDSPLLHDPFLMPEMDRAVRRVQRAIAEREPIAVYGDFDADGITATALLVTGLRRLGAVAQPYIPHRDAGYGLNRPALETLYAEGARLVITVDTGTSAPDEIAHARSIGLDLIVTDHHSIPPDLPQAVAILNPHRKDVAQPYPFPDLTGVGVAFKLLQGVASALDQDLDIDDYLDLVAIGTVADVGLLKDENRFLVGRGLSLLNSPRRAGIRALLQRAGLKAGGLTTRDIGFMIAPRLNAAGRLDHAMLSYRLLTTDNREEAFSLADTLETLNQERRHRTEEAVALAQNLVGEAPTAPILVVADASFAAGIVGLVAGRLAERWYRPAIALEVGEEFSRASARSIPDFNIVAAVGKCADLLERWGGHPAAAGFSIRTERLPELRERLLVIAAQQLAGVALVPTLDIDAAVTPDALPGTAMQALEGLAPHGMGNPEPLLLAYGLRVVDARPIGGEGKHLQITLRDRRAVWRAIGFDLGQQMDSLAARVDVVYTLEADGFSGKGALRLNVKDFRPSEESG